MDPHLLMGRWESQMDRAFNVLLIDDDDDDVFFLKSIVRKESTQIQLQTVGTGKEAIDLFQRISRTPDLILLDLYLPDLHGTELLPLIKANSILTAAPVVVFSTTSDDEDVAKSYEANISAFVRKPIQPDEFANVVRQILGYWYQVTASQERNVD